MTELYKLTEDDYTTKNNTKWGPGVTHTASGRGPICSNGYIHAFNDELLAALLFPIFVTFKRPILWIAEGDVVINDRGLKVGCSRLTTKEIIPLPSFTIERHVRFGILCAKAVYNNPRWNSWANGWLSGERTAYAANAAYAAANAAYAAADPAYAVANAAYAAAYAANAAAYAANAAYAVTNAAYAAAYAAADAAYAVTNAAYAAETKEPLDLINLAKEAVYG